MGILEDNNIRTCETAKKDIAIDETADNFEDFKRILGQDISNYYQDVIVTWNGSEIDIYFTRYNWHFRADCQGFFNGIIPESRIIIAYFNLTTDISSQFVRDNLVRRKNS